MDALRFAILFALLVLPIGRLDAADVPREVKIEVVEGDWGRAHPEDIRQVLQSTAAALLTEGFEVPSVGVRVEHSDRGPWVRFERGPRGEYVVELSARDRRWARFAYQFAHELCHIVSHFDEKTDSSAPAPNQWFEEALCEAAALAALRRLAVNWAAAAPYPHWRDYAPAFDEYARALASEEHRSLPHDTSPAAWYEARQAALRAEPYRRADNEVMANLLLPLFEATPGSWGALGYLNRDGKADSLAQYLGSWHRAAPGRHRPLIEAIAALIALR